MQEIEDFPLHATFTRVVDLSTTSTGAAVTDNSGAAITDNAGVAITES